MDSYLNEKPFRQDLQDYQEFFVCHFPEENDKTQCARRIHVLSCCDIISLD